MKRADRRKIHYIYKTTRVADGYYYIGMHSTDNLEDGYMGSGKWIRNSLKKHGKEAHVKVILEFLPDRESLRNREAEIVTEDLMKDPMNMNFALGGSSGNFGMTATLSEETKRRMSDYRRGRPKSEEHKRKIAEGNRGNKHTDEALVKIKQARAVQQMQPWSDERREKFRKTIEMRRGVQ